MPACDIKSFVATIVFGLAVLLPGLSVSADKQSTESSSNAGQSGLPSAVVWYQEMANKGDKEAQYNLATVYETGFGVVVNYKEAAKWFKKAADQGHVLAELKLGILYYLGEGVRESSIKGDKWIRAAAKSGNELARQLQDKVLAPDLAVELDVKRVVNEVHQALANGDIYANEKLIQILAKAEQERKNPPKKPRFTGKVTGSGAKAGTVKTVVPAFLDKEKEVKPKPLNDLASIRRAAKEGNAEAQDKLGHMYEVGQKVERDQAQAVNWYQMAAQHGQRDAQYRVGLAYLYGLGVTKEDIKAIQWLKKAADQKLEVARQLLSYFKPDAKGKINYDISLLVSVYLERALNGDSDAQLALGYMLEHGWGVQANTADAREWLVRARAGGAKGAAVQLRKMKIADALGAKGHDAKPARVNRSNPSFKNDDFAPPSNRFKSLFIPIGLVLLGLVLGMVVFRWMDRQHGQVVLHKEKEESLF